MFENENWRISLPAILLLLAPNLAAAEGASAPGAEAVVEGDAAAATEVSAAAEAVRAAAEEIALRCVDPEALWIGGEAESSIVSQEGKVLQASVASVGPATRAFRLEAPAQIRLEAVAKGNGDPVLKLMTAEGGLIAENDDAEGSFNSQILQDLPAGQYCAVVDDLRQIVSTTLQVALAETAPLVATESFACGPETEAQPFGAAALDQGIATAPVAAQVDAAVASYLRFEIAAPAALSLRAIGGAGVDPQMALFDAAGNMVASNDDADGVNARLDFHPELPVGRYCLGLRTTGRATGTISVSAETIDLDAMKQRAYARGQLVPTAAEYPVRPLPFNAAQAEVVLQGAAVTWFDFELSEPSLVAINSFGSLAGADTDLKLFDATGALLQENDDAEGDRNARIAPLSLRPGRYFVALSDRQSSEGLGSLLRPVAISAERYIRAPQD